MTTLNLSYDNGYYVLEDGNKFRNRYELTNHLDKTGSRIHPDESVGTLTIWSKLKKYCD